MGVSEVRSPWSLDRGDPHPRRGESPGSRSSPSNPSRADQALPPHSEGKGWTPLDLRNSEPVAPDKRK
jgi:hypothetical protein